jgi:hypothetical protein
MIHTNSGGHDVLAFFRLSKSVATEPSSVRLESFTSVTAAERDLMLQHPVFLALAFCSSAYIYGFSGFP